MPLWIPEDKRSDGVTSLIHSMNTLGVQLLLTNLLFHKRIPILSPEQKYGLVKTVGESLKDHFAKQVAQACFKTSCPAVTNNVMESSFI